MTEFSYGTIPANGGMVEPTLSYRYTAKSKTGETETRTGGATLSFTSDDVMVDGKSGTVSAGANMTYSPASFNVNLRISVGSLTVNETVSVHQDAPVDQIVKSENVQLPIVLAPHVCVVPKLDLLNMDHIVWDFTKEYEFVTTNTEGKQDRVFREPITDGTVGLGGIGNPEYVSVKGVDIKVSGGDLAVVNTYCSGKTDTVIIAKASFSTSTNYYFLEFWNPSTGERYEDDLTQAPSCTYADGEWRIKKIGYGRYLEIFHTLTAKVAGESKQLTIRQMNNYIIGEIPPYIKIDEHKIYTQRDVWPNFEDYPVGSNPKWPSEDDIYHNGDELYHNPDETKDLHPDSNRYIEFGFDIYDYTYVKRPIYLSGAIEPQHSATVRPSGRSDDFRNSFICGGITITATANVKMKDGSTKAVKHESIWIQPEDGSDYYKGKSASYFNCFSIYLPVVENAAEDFIWTLKFDFRLPEQQTLSGFNLKTQTNFFEYDWTFPEYQFKDCLSTVKDYQASKNLYGFFHMQPIYDRCQGNIIDGVEQ